MTIFKEDSDFSFPIFERKVNIQKSQIIQFYKKDS